MEKMMDVKNVIERKEDGNRKPTQEELDGYKAKAGEIRSRLEDVGLIPTKDSTTGAKLVKYFVRTAGVESPKNMTVLQWEAVFSALDTLMKDPKRAMEVINEVGGYPLPTAEEIIRWMNSADYRNLEAAKTRPPAQARPTTCSIEGCLDPVSSWAYNGPRCKTHAAEAQEEWEKRRDQEQQGPHAQRIRELTRSFFQQIEAEGYQGYAIIGIPNAVIRDSSLDTHLEDCEDCSPGDWCDDGFQAFHEDESYDNVFVFETSGVGELEDYCGLAFELAGEGRSSVYDLLSGAENLNEKEPEAAAD